MRFLDRLLGRTIDVVLFDPEGRRRYRRVSPGRLERLRREERLVLRLDRVPVHLLDAVQGPSQTEWVVGEDVTRDVVENHADPETGALYAVVLYEGLEPRETKVTSRARWEELRAGMQR